MKKILYLSAIASLTFASCDVNDPIYETSNPDKGKITLTTDWTNRTVGIAIPASYTARVGTEQATLSGTTAEYPNLLTPGNHTVYLYNTADKITINGTTATVTTTAGVVDPMAGWFFSGKASVIIAADRLHDITVVMKQEVCQLDITLTVTEGDPNNIKSITAELSGIASQLDMSTNEHSVGVKVVPVFTRIDDKLSASVRLLGITGASQKLTLNLTFTDGKTQTIEKDVSSLLASFNTEKHNPMTLAANLNTPIGVGFEATITDWISEGRSGTAN